MLQVVQLQQKCKRLEGELAAAQAATSIAKPQQQEQPTTAAAASRLVASSVQGEPLRYYCMVASKASRAGFWHQCVPLQT